jgi:nucleoid DNA-binding protein
MKRPSTMSVKEWIIKKMAVNMVISEKTIDSVVTHQFDSANDALNIHKSVEISGFGKFYFNTKKALIQYNKLLAKYITCKIGQDRNNVKKDKNYWTRIISKKKKFRNFISKILLIFCVTRLLI